MLDKDPKNKKNIWVKWEPPKNNNYKLNIDGPAAGNPGKGGLGGIFRNASGNWVLGYMGSIQYTTNTQAELLAVLKGLQIAEERQFTPLEINTDSTEVIRMLINGNLHFDSFIHECRSIVQRLGVVVVKHSYRETNKVADMLAKEGTNRNFLEDVFVTTVPPVFVNHLFWADIAGTVFERQIIDCNIANDSLIVGYLIYPPINIPSVNPNG
ncbi:uncharacterized protein LOC142165243 [Nicotiana tabacum]|uniref:Uncharacterized protein LOC142165243 n=1 Tax=Nicotiana tabacum TaxID=4097 RepID=A0AC58S4M5_TOBAC